MARSDQGNTRLGKQLGITSHIKNDRRIVDFFEPRRVAGIVHGHDGYIRCSGASHLFSRKFGGLSCGQGLGGNRLQAGTFKLGERGPEDCIGGSEMLDQLSCSCGSQTWGQ
jgi:hypothetical protein